MGKWKKDAQGHFAGSIGEGKHEVPQPAFRPKDPAGSGTDSPGKPAVDFANLAARARTRLEPDPRFAYLTAAEQRVDDAIQRWEQARTWAYPGVGDEEGEQELAESYEDLSLARHNLFNARLLAAQEEDGETLLEEQMVKWNARGEQAAVEDGDDALRYFVRAQEIHDALTQARKQKEAQEAFNRIIEAETASLRQH